MEEMHLSFFAAIVLGIVEGLTEFLPISSTGHMILVGQAIGVSGGVVETFEIFIQLGAILAVMLLYRDRFFKLLDFSANCGNEFRGQRGILLLSVACMPAFVFGFLLHKYIKENLFSTTTVAAALIVGAIMILIVEHRCGNKKNILQLKQINVKSALVIGLFQCLALWPGMSRSASTIIGGLVCGLDRKLAAEFSFLVAVPVMFAAVGYDLLKSYATLSIDHLPIFAVGFVVAFLSGVIAVKAFIKLLSRFTLLPFAYYRIAIGVLVLLLAR